jgi:hypothetical protein
MVPPSLPASGDKLWEAVGRLARRHRQASQRAAVDLAPGCAYGVRYAQALEDLRREVAEVKARLNGLLFLLGGTVAVQLILRLMT